jgi:tungstate transport system substrate-binding protein
MASATTRFEPAPEATGGWSRREILAGAGVLGTALMAACTPGRSAPAAAQGARATVGHGVVRLLSVPTVSDGGEWGEVLPAFSRQTGIDVKLQIATNDLFDRARRGEADLVYSHYGHADVSGFVLRGYGQWPRTILSNMIALLGPPADPAGVRGLTDLAEAFRRIAASGATYEVNGSPGLAYVVRIVLAAGGLGTGAWYVDDGLREAQAVQRASASGAYTLWGVTPFLELAARTPLKLTPLVTADPILQRLMVSIIVSPDKVRGVNASTARTLQDYLLSPATQARIRVSRHPQLGIPIFFPAGRDNEAAALPAG